MKGALCAGLAAVALLHAEQGHAISPPAPDAPWPAARPLRVEGATLSGNYLFDVVKRSRVHAETLSRLLRGKRGLPAWVRNMVSRGNYVTAASTQVMVGGVAMELFSACQPHNCADSQLKVLFSADGKTAYMRVRDEKLGETLLGDPSPAQKLPLMADGL